MLRVLNLYAGLGGNRKNWKDVSVTAVEMEQGIANVYSSQFPNDTIIIGDAHEYLLRHADEFDFIWSSPPCQTHSKMMKSTIKRHNKKRYMDMSLYQEILFLEHFFNGHWVVENVKPFYDPLIPPSRILGRHCFWSNFRIGNFEIETPPNFIKSTTVKGAQQLKDWLGIQYDENIYYKGNHCPGQVLRNCVHPKLGEYIFNCSRGPQKQNTTPQAQLF